MENTMETKQKYTAEEIIEMSINDIGRIQIPIAMEGLSDELRRIRGNLINLLMAMKEPKPEEKPKEDLPDISGVFDEAEGEEDDA